jgi:hypothetical protein
MTQAEQITIHSKGSTFEGYIPIHATPFSTIREIATLKPPHAIRGSAS